MTALFPIPTLQQAPGIASVADLRAMDGAQALAVLLLRDWLHGPEGRLRVATLFADALGASAESHFMHWRDFADLLDHASRRPLTCRELTCRHVGADEATVANLLILAASGEREDAMMILSLLVPGDRLLPAVHMAEQAGLSVIRAALALDRIRGPVLH